MVDLVEKIFEETFDKEKRVLIVSPNEERILKTARAYEWYMAEEGMCFRGYRVIVKE